jgi:uncharacterized protein YgbK (DUF1537 family)
VPNAAVADTLARFLHDLVPTNPQCSAFVATGGSTAEALRRALGADRLVMTGPEALPAAPIALIEGGPFTGRPFLTKPGAFGDSHSLASLIQVARIAGLARRR